MAKRRRGRDISGILLLDKPGGESSNRSLQRAKYLFQAAKAGHTGSLDPLATGVLPLCFGEATKISQFLLDSDKVYRTRIRFGVRTDTGDSEGEIIRTCDASGLTSSSLEQALTRFQGQISQVPSMYSALKHQGQPLYKLARQGKTVEREARLITIHSISLLDFDAGEAEIEVHCSKGTYIRTLADDLGEELGTGAHVVALRRLQAGPFRLDNCVTHEFLENTLREGDFTALDSLLESCDTAIIHLPAVTLPAATAAFVMQGQPVIARHLPVEGLVRLYEEESFIGIGEILDDGRVAPKRLLKGR